MNRILARRRLDGVALRKQQPMRNYRGFLHQGSFVWLAEADECCQMVSGSVASQLRRNYTSGELTAITEKSRTDGERFSRDYSASLRSEVVSSCACLVHPVRTLSYPAHRFHYLFVRHEFGSQALYFSRRDVSRAYLSQHRCLLLISSRPIVPCHDRLFRREI